jgi:tetratricopeptide (TPR) repeat protein
VALFGKKKQDDGGDAESGNTAFTPQPQKAQRWLDQAKTIADTGNFPYALTCFVSAIKLDPTPMSSHLAMYEAAVGHHRSNGQPASRKELKDVDGPGPIDKFAAAEMAWMRDLNNHTLALRLLDACVKADQMEFGQWLAPKVLNMIRNSKKQSKSDYVKAKNLFSQVGAWDEAFMAGEAAVKIDPSDAGLVQDLKQLTAQRAIVSGGYEDAANEKGNFRTAVKDLEEQQRLEDESSILGGSADERAVEHARKELEENMGSPEAVQKLAKLLLRQNTAEATSDAHDVYMAGYERLKQYRFRMAAGDIRLHESEEKVRVLEKQLEETPDDETLRDRITAASADLTSLKAAEFGERAVKYPTDRAIKFELGNVLFEQGDFESAMANFQDSKDEPKFKVASAHRLGRCFAEEGWNQEAVAEYRESLESLDATSRDMELPIKYDMMVSLIALARDSRSRELAEEAAEICSAIVRKDIKYRDIRDRRREIDELSKSFD